MILCSLTCIFSLFGNNRSIEKWHKKELVFESEKGYDNPLYEVDFFGAEFISPSGETFLVRGFWDGGNSWKIRFMPNQTGRWKYKVICSDETNSALHGKEGTFRSVRNRDKHEIYRRGSLKHPEGTYYLSYDDGVPFFYVGCTAWNGGLLSTADEWEAYLTDRKKNGYSVIQLVTTQWRGAPVNAENEKAFTGIDTIRINPTFFKRMDERIDRVNEHGVVAAPIMLWALGDISPGVFLPEKPAIKLAEYILARYDGNHVVWNLGGDGNYTGNNENRWKNIGREVFGTNYHRNPVTLHPRGFSWYGAGFNEETWLDMISYQTGHDNRERNVRWKTQGPVASEWKKLIARPIIDTEPTYENGHNSKEVRNSAYWSIFATPVAGISYGSHTIWPWLRVGDVPINHGKKEPSDITWQDALSHPGSIQIGYLSGFFSKLEWWKLFPANELLKEQPGTDAPQQWQSVLATHDRKTILVYLPSKDATTLVNAHEKRYSVQWFEPKSNTYLKPEMAPVKKEFYLENPFDSDAIVILQSSQLSAQPVVERWRMHEITLKGTSKGNPFTETSLDGYFHQGPDTLRVRGFYDGDGLYRVRFSPPKEGEWNYYTVSNQKKLNNKRGKIACVAAEAQNKGPVRIDQENPFGFSYANDTPFHPFGTTLYAWAHQADSLAQRTVQTLSEGYFNKVRMCVFPKAYWWNQAEPSLYPFEGTPLEEWDFTRLNPQFFQNLEQRILQLDSLGIEVDLILFHPYDRWGFSKMDSLSNYRYLDYVMARLSAFKNVWWSLANEFDFVEQLTLEDWDALIAHVAKNDPYSRLRSIHNGVAMYDHSHPLVSHASIQTDDISSIPRWREAYQKPIIIDECGYEGDIPWFWGQLTPEALLAKFWEGITRGAYVSHGETYLEQARTDRRVEENDDVLWWSKGGVLRGKSPERIAFLHEIVASGAGSRAASEEDYLVYFGDRQPALHLMEFPSNETYEVTVIDTWNMTARTLEKEYSGYSLIPLPSKPYMALRIKKQ